MLQNQYTYSRERRRMGRQCMFNDRTQYMVSVTSSLKTRMRYILRNPSMGSTQESVQKALTIVETENVTYTEHGMLHYEGGWPKEVNINDEEATLRHRKKVEREDNYGGQVMFMINRSVESVEQNASVNIYEEFFVHLPPEMAAELHNMFEARQMTLFHDILKMAPRSATCLDWSPARRNAFVALHTYFETTLENIPIIEPTPPQPPPDLDLDDIYDDDDEIDELRAPTDVSRYSFYLWELENPIKPNSTFEAEGPVYIVRFCPKEELNVAGGLESGMVALWNSEEGGDPVAITPLETAHREPCSALCWVHSKQNNEFYSGSWDGEIKYWDCHNLMQPEQEFLCDPEPTDEQKRERAHGITVMEFEYTIPVRYILCTTHGYIFIGNRKGITPTDTLITNYKLFQGPIRSIERNPYFVKYFLVVGDWCCKIWAEEFKTGPTTLVFKKKNQMLCGAWSHARCSVFVTGDICGQVDFWDLLLDHREPVYRYTYSRPITALKFRQDGNYLGVCLESGDVHVLELDDALKKNTSKDKSLIAALFERELLRGKLLEQRFDEVRLKRNTRAAPVVYSDELKSEERELLRNLNPDDPDQFLQLMEIDVQFKNILTSFHDTITKIEYKRAERDRVLELTSFERDSMVYGLPGRPGGLSRITEGSVAGTDPRSESMPSY